MSSKNHDLDYKAVLGLRKDPFSRKPDPSSYYAFESFEQHLTAFKDLVEGTDVLVLVSGKGGCGKTTLLNRYLSSSHQIWKPCRIQIDPDSAAAQTPEQEEHRIHSAYILHDSKEPIVIVDDAHELTRTELRLLIRETLLPGILPKIKRLVLLGDTGLFTTVTNLAKTFSTQITINQIYLPGLAEEESAAYLKHRMAAAGYTGERLFTGSTVKKLHQKSAGLPGLMNDAADQWLKENYSPGRKGRGIFRRMADRPLFAFGWIAACIVLVFLAALMIYPHREAAVSLLQDLKLGPKIFRTKLSEDLKKAQNLFRQKIPVSDQPLKPQKKNENIIPVEKKTKSSRLALLQTEKGGQQREAGLPLPLQPQKIFETPSPVEEKPISSQPTVAPLEKKELPKVEHPKEQIRPRINIETSRPINARPVPSPPTVVSPEKRESPEKTELNQLKMRPPLLVKKGVKEKAEERRIHREKWLLSQKASYYTIQIMGVRKDDLIIEFVEKHQLPKYSEIAYYQTTFKGNPWFQLLYGVYPTKKDAQLDADNLSAKISNLSPWIRRLSAVQKAIRKKASQ